MSSTQSEPQREPDRSPASLLESILAQLRLDEPIDLHVSEQPSARRLRELLQAHKIDHQALISLMQWSGNQTKAARMLDAAIRGEKCPSAFLARAFEVLGVPSSETSAIFSADREFQNKREENHHLRRRHRMFQRYGPHILAVEHGENRPHSMHSGVYHLLARVEFKTSYREIEPLSVAEVASAIRAGASWIPRIPQSLVKHYIYHRMPDETYLIDRHGDVINADS